MHVQSCHFEQITPPGLGTTAYRQRAGASQRPTPSLVRAFPPSLLLVHPCEAQRCEGLGRHQSADRPPEMKRSTHITARLVVLAVCLDPVQTERVQERRQTLQDKPRSDVSGKIHASQLPRTSMMHRIKTVKLNQRTNTSAFAIKPKIPSQDSATPIVISHNTSDSWA